MCANFRRILHAPRSAVERHRRLITLEMDLPPFANSSQIGVTFSEGGRSFAGMDAHGSELGFTAYAVILLAAAVILVPIFKRLGLGSVLAYLVAGVILGPITGVISGGEDILHFAELGVVLLLFVIGLELKPSRLWAMRRDIFGLGAAQVIISGLLIALPCVLVLGQNMSAAIVIGFGLALSSTAFGLQILEERGERSTVHGQKGFSILLFQDLAIVPLIALISVLAPGALSQGEMNIDFTQIAIMIGAVAIVVLSGRYLLNPFFGILARSNAREIMTGAALLIVLGSAMIMQVAGLSMAMGAFLAGVLLAESSYRHELEADIEPFRGLLLGLFFMAVGLSLDLDVVLANWLPILFLTPFLLIGKAIAIYALMRLFGNPHNPSVRGATLLPQAGEFGFVLFTQAAGVALISDSTASILTAIITFSMALTPLSVAISKYFERDAGSEEDIEEDFEDAGANVLMIGFSRFGQIAAQHLLAEGVNVTIIDNDAERIRNASKFGFKIYYGDGTRLDVLRMAGAGDAEVVCICVHSPQIANDIVDILKVEAPTSRLFVRSFDRTHTLELMSKGVDFEIRETFESAMIFGEETLMALGVTPVRAKEVSEDVRKRDIERLSLQQADGMYAGIDVLHRKMTPEPLTRPAREAKALSEETADIAASPDQSEPAA